MPRNVAIDEELLARARESTGMQDIADLVHEGLKALIQRQAARELIELGGTMPDAEAPSRRRFDG